MPIFDLSMDDTHGFLHQSKRFDIRCYSPVFANEPGLLPPALPVSRE